MFVAFNNKKVSIIMPCFNSEDTLSDSIKSVLKQTYEMFELIIIDDGSSDRSKHVASSFKDSRIIILDNRYDQGARGARQTGIDFSTGRYIAFLDSDDLWLPNKLMSQIDFMRKNQVEFSYSNYTMFTEERRWDFDAPGSVSFEDIIKTCSIGCLTVVLDRKKIDFPIIIPNIAKEDYALWMYLLKKTGIRARNSGLNTAEYRVQKNSLSSNKVKEIKKQIMVLRSIGELGIIRTFFCIFSYVYHGLRKHKV